MIAVLSLGETWLDSLLDVSIKALALGLLASLWLGIGRVRCPSLRHAVWATVLCGMLALPLLGLAMPGIILPLLPPTASRSADPATVVSMALERSRAGAEIELRERRAATGPEGPIRGPDVQASPAKAEITQSEPKARVRWSPSVIALIGYLVGVVVLLARFAVGLAGCRRIVRGSRALAPEQLVVGCSPPIARALIRHRVLVRICPHVRVPLTLGWLRPTILLPEGSATWDASKREAVLAHELAHVERRDALLVALGAINQCLYWFHPLAWLVPKRLAALSERACDERAIALTGQPIRYARHLLEFAAAMVDRRDRVALGVLSMADGGDLGTRMEAILNRKRAGSAPLTRRGRLLLTAMAVLIVPALAALRVGPRVLGEAMPAGELRSEAPAAEEKSVTVKGIVLDPDDRPIAGAKLVVPYHSKAGWLQIDRGVSGPDGHFRFTIAESEFRDCSYENPLAFLSVAAAADGLGFNWLEHDVVSNGGDLTLQLVRDVPIRGRVVDLQGKPVAGARVGVRGVSTYSGEDLGPAIQANHDGRVLSPTLKLWSGRLPGQPRDATTGTDGRFRLAGIGRERGAWLQIEGPTIATKSFSAITRDPEAVGGPLRDPNRMGQRIYAATFDFVAQPSRLIRGIVRDRQTGQPVAGTAIQGPLTSVRTDDAGRFELTGYPKSPKYSFAVSPPPGGPFLAFDFHLDDAPGFEPLSAEIQLTPGIPVRGRVIEEGTHQPVKGQVEYHPLFPNSNLTGFGSKAHSPRSQMAVGADGSFTLAALPGPGVVVFQAHGGDYYQKYMPASVDRDALKKLVKDVPFFEQSDFLQLAAGGGAMSPLLLRNYNVAALIDPAADAKVLKLDLVPRRGRTIEGTVVGLDGEPLAGVSIVGLTSHKFHREHLATPRFQVKSLNPIQKRELSFHHPAKGLGAYKEIRGDEPGPLTIRLERCGSAVGRVLDEHGHPVAGRILYCDRDCGIAWENHVRTDREGRFRIDGLAPGQPYIIRYSRAQISLHKTFQLEPGQVKDLGDARIEPDPAGGTE
jgi:beta-lactamase regulating signal transducer with metallopeptidase domain